MPAGRPQRPDIAPDAIPVAGQLLFGDQWMEPMARFLGVNRATIVRWRDGEMRPSPGARMQLADELERRAKLMAPAANGLRAGLGGLHGLAKHEVELIGWVIGDTWIMDGDEWLAAYASPAEVLRKRVAVDLGEHLEGGRAKLSEGEADRLLTALGRLTDAQALEVERAARPVSTP